MATNDLDRSLEQLWEEARAKFKEATKGADIGQAPGKMDTVLSQLEKTYAPSEEAPIKKKAQRVVADVLKVVQLIGGLACQGASVIFSPAGMCFNAVSFLIDGVGRMKSFHSNLAAMFEAIKTFLVHFRMLQRIEGQFDKIDGTKLPQEMIMNTNKLMCSFVNMCTYTYKSMKRGKFKAAMVDLKVSFVDDDDGVKAELTRFKTLIEEQDSVKGTITLEEVMKSRADIKQLLERAAEEHDLHVQTRDNVGDIKRNLDAREKKEDAEARKKKIAAKLGLGSAKDKDPPIVYRRQTDRFDEIKNARLPKTGEWLDDHEIYASWRDSTRQSSPLLFLSGTRGTGKSFLASKVVDKWQDSDAPDNRTAVAYYFFVDRNERKDANESDDVVEGRRSFSTALRCMAYMLYMANAKYALELENSEELKDEAALKSLSCERLWEVLRFSAPRSTSFILVFDGLDQLANHEELMRLLGSSSDLASKKSIGAEDGMRSAAPLSAQPGPKPRTRVLVTVDEDYVPNLNSFGGECLRFISTDDDAASNTTDIELFLDETIKTKGGQLDELARDPKNEDLFKDFRKHLLRIANGRFSVIENRIRLVRQQLDGDIERDELKAVMLSNKEDDQFELAKQVLKNLETALKPREITQINDMLTWIIWSTGDDLTLEEIDAAAALNKASANSWQSFTQKISTRNGYKDLFKLKQEDGNGTVGVHDHLVEYLRGMKWTPAADDSEAAASSRPKISLSINIDAADPKAVKRFLWDLHEKISYDRSFFAVSGSEVSNRASIQVDEVSSISRLLIQCLDLMNEESDTSTKALLDHAVKYVPFYLWRATCIEEERRIYFPEKVTIISKLIAFLSQDSDNESIFKSAAFAYEAYSKWLEDENYRKAMDKWLNEKVAQQLEVEQKRSLRKLLKSTDGVAAYMFPLVRRMAHNWILVEESDNWTYSYSYKWVDAFLTLRHEYTTSPNTTDSAASDASKDADKAEFVLPSAKARVVQCADWAQKALNLKERDSLFLERMAYAFRLSGEHREAAQMFEEAAKTSKHPGAVYRYVAICYWILDELEPAIGALQKSIDGPMDEGETSEKHASRILEDMQFLGRIYSKANNIDKMVEVFKDLIKQDPKDHKGHLVLLQVLADSTAPEQGAEILQSLHDQKAEAEDSTEIKTRLAEIIRLTIERETSMWSLNFLPELAFRIGKLDIVSQGLEATRLHFARDEEPEHKHLVGLMLALQGISLALSNRSEEGHAKAFRMWTDALECISNVQNADEWTISYTRAQLKNYCAHYHFTQLRTSATPESHLRSIKTLSGPTGKDKVDVGTKWLLANAYKTTGKTEQARSVLRKDLDEALEILSDKDPKNDWQGYMRLTDIFAHLEDIPNALAAQSLLGPDVEKYDREMEEYRKSQASKKQPVEPGKETKSDDEPAKNGDLTTTVTNGGDSSAKASSLKAPILEGSVKFWCSGSCDSEWFYPSDIWICCVCSDVIFCGSCHDKVLDGTMSTFVCHSSHLFYRVPTWKRSEYDKIANDHVRIPKKVADGEGDDGIGEWSFEQGETMPASQWIDQIKDAWGIERSVPETEAASKEDDDIVMLKPLSETRRRTQTIGA